MLNTTAPGSRKLTLHPWSDAELLEVAAVGVPGAVVVVMRPAEAVVVKTSPCPSYYGGEKVLLTKRCCWLNGENCK